jgi:hypothetical protein
MLEMTHELLLLPILGSFPCEIFVAARWMPQQIRQGLNRPGRRQNRVPDTPETSCECRMPATKTGAPGCTLEVEIQQSQPQTAGGGQ